MPGTVVITRSASVNKTAKDLHLHMVPILVASLEAGTVSYSSLNPEHLVKFGISGDLSKYL